MIDPRVQAVFKRSRHNTSSTFINSQYYNKLPKRTIRTNENIYHTFKTNNFRDVQNVYQDRTTMDMTFIELKYLTSTCWDEKYQPPTIDMTEKKYTSRYRLGLNKLFVPDSSLFRIS